MENYVKDKVVIITGGSSGFGLEAAGLPCWIAPRDLSAGTQWGAGIVQAIETCETVLVVFSQAANDSPQVAREMELAAHWLHKGGVVLHFAGVDSISAAETLSGLIVAIPRTERAALGEDEVYTGDLIGCALVDVAGDEPFTVGEIEDVDTTAGPVALLVVRGAAGEVLVPFAKSYLRKVDLEAKRVEMALPEGLVDLNAAGKAQ